jgi:hypothetical protein
MTTTSLLVLLLILAFQEATPYATLRGVKITSVRNGDQVDLGEYLKTPAEGKSLFIFGTYAADFNAIEYAQRLRHYLPKLREECGISQFGLLLSCQPDAALSLSEQVDLPTDVDLFVDNKGQAARQWGVERGFLPDNKDVNPYIKLFGMLWGLVSPF